MSEAVINNLINVRQALRQKYLDLQKDNFDDSYAREQVFEPITKPLKALVNNSTAGGKSNILPISTTSINNEVDQDSYFIDTEFSNIKSSTPRIILKSDPSIASKIKRNYFHEAQDTRVEPDLKPDNDHEEEQEDTPSLSESETVYEDIPVEEGKQDTSKLTLLKRGYTNLFKEKVGDIAGKYIRLLFSPKKEHIDQVFGFTNLSDSGLAIGPKNIAIIDNDLYIDDKVYKGTPGLYELITLARPQAYTKADLNTYKEILLHTKAHLTLNGRLKSSRSVKYLTIIKKLFPPKVGGSYQYWNDPNELVERLRLLMGSLDAGNTSHHNEIIDIVDELREAKIIF